MCEPILIVFFFIKYIYNSRSVIIHFKLQSKKISALNTHICTQNYTLFLLKQKNCLKGIFGETYGMHVFVCLYENTSVNHSLFSRLIGIAINILICIYLLFCCFILNRFFFFLKYVNS